MAFKILFDLVGMPLVCSYYYQYLISTNGNFVHTAWQVYFRFCFNFEDVGYLSFVKCILENSVKSSTVHRAEIMWPFFVRTFQATQTSLKVF